MSLHNRCGTPEGTRTPDPLLRRQLLYPPELQAHIPGYQLFSVPVERAMGIEPTLPAWKAGVLPLNHARESTCAVRTPVQKYANRNERALLCSEAFALTFHSLNILPHFSLFVKPFFPSAEKNCFPASLTDIFSGGGQKYLQYLQISCIL